MQAGIRWLLPSTDLVLAQAEIHIWRIELDRRPMPIEHLEKILSEDERDRAQRFKFYQDKARFIVGRYALRSILARYLDIAPERLQFSYNGYGKPTLKYPGQSINIHFNLTHSANLALMACVRNAEIGIDVEWIHMPPDMESIARHQFSTSELAGFLAVAAEDRPDLFHTIWTRKEAYLKARGVGLNATLTNINIVPLSDNAARIMTVGDTAEETKVYLLHTFRPVPGYIAAVATERLDNRITYWQFLPSSA